LSVSFGFLNWWSKRGGSSEAASKGGVVGSGFFNLITRPDMILVEAFNVGSILLNNMSLQWLPGIFYAVCVKTRLIIILSVWYCAGWAIGAWENRKKSSSSADASKALVTNGADYGATPASGNIIPVAVGNCEGSTATPNSTTISTHVDSGCTEASPMVQQVDEKSTITVIIPIDNSATAAESSSKGSRSGPLTWWKDADWTVAVGISLIVFGGISSSVGGRAPAIGGKDGKSGGGGLPSTANTQQNLAYGGFIFALGIVFRALRELMQSRILVQKKMDAVERVAASSPAQFIFCLLICLPVEGFTPFKILLLGDGAEANASRMWVFMAAVLSACLVTQSAKVVAMVDVVWTDCIGYVTAGWLTLASVFLMGEAVTMSQILGMGVMYVGCGLWARYLSGGQLPAQKAATTGSSMQPQSIYISSLLVGCLCVVSLWAVGVHHSKAK